jgi:hypothetical protein
MSGVFRNIDPPPPLRCTPRLWCAGGHTRWVERGVGGQYSIVRKTPDTALYSIYESTLWLNQTLDLQTSCGTCGQTLL